LRLVVQPYINNKKKKCLDESLYKQKARKNNF